MDQPRQCGELGSPAVGRGVSWGVCWSAHKNSSLAIGEHDVPGRVQCGERRRRRHPSVGEGSRQESTAVVRPLPQLSLGSCGDFAEPRQHTIGQRRLPARNVEYGEWVVGDDVADSDAGTHPRMKASTPVFWAPDHDGAVAFQSGSHAVGTAGPFRPGEPGGQVAVRGSVKDAPTSPAADVARPPSSANTTSWSIECALTSPAAGARSKRGSTSYSSRHRYQDMRISGRTPWTVSAPAAKRSQAAVVLLRLSPASAAPLVAGEWPLVCPSAPFIPAPLGGGEGPVQDRLANAPTTRWQGRLVPG